MDYIIVFGSDVIDIKQVKDYLKKISFRQRILGCHVTSCALRLHIVEVGLFYPKGSMFWICLMKLTC